MDGVIFLSKKEDKRVYFTECVWYVQSVLTFLELWPLRQLPVFNIFWSISPNISLGTFECQQRPLGSFSW